VGETRAAAAGVSTGPAAASRSGEAPGPPPAADGGFRARDGARCSSRRGTRGCGGIGDGTRSRRSSVAIRRGRGGKPGAGSRAVARGPQPRIDSTPGTGTARCFGERQPLQRPPPRPGSRAGTPEPSPWFHTESRKQRAPDFFTPFLLFHHLLPRLSAVPEEVPANLPLPPRQSCAPGAPMPRRAPVRVFGRVPAAFIP